MSKVVVTEAYLNDIAEAIRAKNGSSATYTPGQMAAAIEAIPTGGDTPTGTITISQNGTYNVAQYASADVDVEGSGVIISADEPSASVGSDGDYYIRDDPQGLVLLSDGTAKLDTGIASDTVYGAEFDVEVITLKTNYQVFVSSVSDNFTVGNYNNISKCFVRVRGTASNNHDIFVGKNRFVFSNGIVYLNDTQITTYNPSQSLGTSGNVCLFTPSNEARMSNIKITKLKLYDVNGDLLFDGSPAASGNIAGMYDAVSDTFIAATGDVELDAGRIVELYQKQNGVWQVIAD